MRLGKVKPKGLLHQCYFYMTAKEVDELFAEVKRDNIDLNFKDSRHDNLLQNLAYQTFESYNLADEMSKLNIVTFGDYNVRYFTKLEKGKPLVGSVVVCSLPDVTNIMLPRIVPDEVVKHTTPKEIDDIFDLISLNNGFYDLNDIEVADDRSYITYDLRFSKNLVTLNIIRDQNFDMTTQDNDIDPEKFIGVKVGDTVILSTDDDVYIEAIIKSICHKCPKQLTDSDLKKLNNPLGINAVSEFKDYISELLMLRSLLDSYTNFILEFASTNSQPELQSDEIVNFFMQDYSDLVDEDNTIIKEKVKRDIMLDCLNAIITIKDQSFEISDSELKKIVDLSSLHCLILAIDDEDYKDDIFQDYMKKMILLKYCVDNRIINNIKL